MANNDIRIVYTVDTDDLKKAQVEFDKLTKEEQDALTALKKYNDELGDTGSEADKAKKKLKDTFDEGKKGAKGAGDSIGNLSGVVGKFGGIVAGAFSIGAIVSFGKQALETAGRFEKLSAVLKTTLGSGSAAEGAMLRIQEIASTTPFSVEELTNSFVKLANQGFKPTNQQIIALGDLASSTGKQFDQLAEALIDAQVGEFERLKEFGIRAAKAGDQITFTFKGQQTVVRNTSEEIQKYLISLGQINGVAGSMAAISATTEGAVSNLGDAWDGFLASIGNNLAPVYKRTLKFTSEFLTDLKDLFQTEDGKIAEQRGKSYNKYTEQLTKNSTQALKNVETNSFKQIEIEKKKLEELEAINSETYQDINEAAMLAGNQAGLLKSKRDDTLIQAEVTKQKRKLSQLEAMNQAAHDLIIQRTDAEKAAKEAADKKAKEDAILNEKKAKELQAKREKEYQLAVRQIELEKQITQERIKQTVPQDSQAIAMKEAEMAANIELQKLAEKYAKKNVQDAKDKAKLLPQIVKTQNKEITDQYIKDGIKERESRVNSEIKTAEDLYKINHDQITKREKIEADVLASLGLSDEELKKKLIQNQILFNEDRIAENERAANDGVATAIDANDILIAENKKLNAQLLEDDRNTAEEKKKIIMSSIDLVAQATNQSLNLYQSQLDAELSAANKRFDEEVRLADGNKQKLAEIEQRKAEKEKEIRLKQFRANQIAAIANVVFQTAPQIAEYLAGVVTAPLAAIGIAAQALQIGAILAQPVPEYAEGTKGKRHKGGHAIVGERGTERVVTESGKVYYTPPTATLLDLPKGAQVIPNHLLSRQEINYASMSRFGRSGKEENISGQLTEIGGILKGLPIHQITMDERGFEKFIRTPNRTSKILNNRFGINS